MVKTVSASAFSLDCAGEEFMCQCSQLPNITKVGGRHGLRNEMCTMCKGSYVYS